MSQKRDATLYGRSTNNEANFTFFLFIFFTLALFYPDPVASKVWLCAEMINNGEEN